MIYAAFGFGVVVGIMGCMIWAFLAMRPFPVGKNWKDDKSRGMLWQSVGDPRFNCHGVHESAKIDSKDWEKLREYCATDGSIEKELRDKMYNGVPGPDKMHDGVPVERYNVERLRNGKLDNTSEIIEVNNELWRIVSNDMQKAIGAGRIYSGMNYRHMANILLDYNVSLKHWNRDKITRYIARWCELNPPSGSGEGC